MSAMLAAIMTLMLAPSLFQQRGAAATGFGISGRVVDARSGKPLGDAVAVLWERSKTRSTGRRLPVNSNGTFEFIGIPPGLYRLAAEVPGARLSYRMESVDIEIRDRDVSGLGLLITPLGPPLVTVNGKIAVEGGRRVPASLTRISNGQESSPVGSDGSFQLRLSSDEKYQVTLENLPEGYYIKAVSAGSWDPAAEVLVFNSRPPSSLQITLAEGTRRIRGRILDRMGRPAGSQTLVTLSGPARSTPARKVSLNGDGTFEVNRLGPGDYELMGRLGTGNAMQFATLQLNIANQDRAGIELVLKPLTVQKGRVVIEGVGRIEELLRFRPMVEITDVLGVRQVAVRRDGTFEFQSFEGEYSVDMNDLPIEYDDPSIEIDGSSVDVRLRIILTDAPFRFTPPLLR